jgi:hypothetical protein
MLSFTSTETDLEEADHARTTWLYEDGMLVTVQAVAETLIPRH